MGNQVIVDNQAMWQAVLDRDSAFDGGFVYGVRTTGVYCRPSCPSRRPNRENVVFYPSPEQARNAGLRPCKRCKPDDGEVPQTELAQQITSYIHEHLEQAPSLKELSSTFHLSPFHLQRTFKRVMGVTPKQYAMALRMECFKGSVKRGESITNAQNEAGFGSSSRLYQNSYEQLGMTPAIYRKGGVGVVIQYAITDSPLGRLLMAMTEKGLCMVSFGDEDAALEVSLTAEYPNAVLQRDVTGLQVVMDEMLDYLTGKRKTFDLPVDVPGTPFQWQVWRALQAIPYGVTRTYQEIAQAIGNPKAVRAVGHACATNRVALVIPCHRAIRVGGGLGGYRWGLERKERLLTQEQQ
jgi:AraC family transcriptional regulator of adaptative response/methylated-DNA-[protein]-cysteine methyltransferase